MIPLDLEKRLIEAAQGFAATVDGFDKGSVRVLIIPGKVQRAQEEIGHFPTGFSDAIRPEEPTDVFIEGWGWYDCYGFAGLKEAGCRYVIELGFGNKSSDLPDGLKFEGRENDPGSVGWVINFDTTKIHQGAGGVGTYATVIVSVSGDTGENDELAALTSLPVLQAWCEERNVEDNLGLYIETDLGYYTENCRLIPPLVDLCMRKNKPPGES